MGKSMHPVGDKSNAVIKDSRMNGFTLLEAVVVITILVIVVVIALSALSRVRQISVRTVCQANLHSIGMAVIAYSVDYHWALPTYYADPTITFDTFRMRTDTGKFVNLGLLLQYADNPKLFYCSGQDASTSPSIAYDTPDNRWQSEGTAGAGGGGGGGGGSGGSMNGGSGVEPGPRPGLNSSYTVRFRRPDDVNAPAWIITNYANKVIYSDFVGVDDWPGRGRFAHRIRSPHQGKGYNRHFGDGSVHWADADSINTLRPLSGAEPTADELNQYFLLLDVLR